MKFLNHNKFFSKFLPAIITAILLASGFLAYTILRPQTKTAQADWYATDGTWSYRKSVIVDHNRVSSTATTTLYSFPMLFSVTDPELRTAANGGRVGKDDGTDILFTSSDGVTKLAHEIEKYASTTGETVIWVNTDLSGTTDTTLYIYFGNAAAADMQTVAPTKTAVWDSNYKAVYHLKETLTGANQNVYDSTANMATATSTNSWAASQQQAGRIGGGLYFNASVAIINSTTTLFNFGANSFSYSFWAKSNSAAQLGAPFSKAAHGYGEPGWRVLYYSNIGQAYCYLADTGGAHTIEAGMSVKNYESQWIHFSIVWDSSAKKQYVYRNGVYQFETLSSSMGDTYNSSRAMYIGKLATGYNFTGWIDEPRISSGTRSTDWIATEYNNQSIPNSFYIYSVLQTPNGRPATTPSVGISGKTGTSPGWFATGGTWGYRKSIVVDHNRVSSTATTTLYGFPMLFTVTDPDLKTIANGGKMGKSDGTDIVVTASDGVTNLPYEIEKYNPATGETVLWIKTDLSGTTDTLLYLFFGNADSADQSNRTGVWDANFLGVWHMKEDPSTGSEPRIKDSTSTGMDATTSGIWTATSSIPGIANSAFTFASTTSNLSTATSTSSGINNASQLTVSAWIKRDVAAGYGKVLNKGALGAGSSNSSFYVIDYSATLENVEFGMVSSTTPNAVSGIKNYKNFIVPFSQWHYVSFTYGDSAIKGYLNGVVNGSSVAATGTIITSNSTGVNFGTDMYGGANTSGMNMDEVRISNTARSADWIKTEYNNQYQPYKFYSYKSALTQESRPATSPPIKLRGGIKFK